MTFDCLMSILEAYTISAWQRDIRGILEGYQGDIIATKLPCKVIKKTRKEEIKGLPQSFSKDMIVWPGAYDLINSSLMETNKREP